MTQQATQQLARPSPPALLGCRCLLSREGVRMDRERAADQKRIDIWRTETEQSRAPIFFLFRVTLVDRGPLQKPCSDHGHPPPPPKCSTKTPPKQIAPCPRREVHDWAVCPYAHAGEKARRRDPVGSCSGDPSLAAAPCEQLYTGIACPSMKSVSRLCAFVSIRIAAVKESRFSRMKIGARERESERTRERDFSSRSRSPLPLFSLSSSSLRLGPVTAEIAAHMPTTSSNTGFILRGKERKLEAGRAR